MSIENKKHTLDSIQKLSNIRHNNNFIVLKDQKYINNKNNLKFYCKNCHNVIEQRVDNHLNGAKCSICSYNNKNLKIEEIRNRIYNIFGDKYFIPEQEIFGVKNKIKVFCNECKDYFEIRLNTFLSGFGCSKCKYNNLRLSLNDVRNRSKELYGNKYYIPEQEIRNNKFFIKIHCNDCGENFNIIQYAHFRGDGGCSNCALKKRTNSIEKIIQRSKEIHGDIYIIDENQEIKNNKSIIRIFCKKCKNYFNQKIYDHLNGSGCPYCRMSRGEIIIQNYLMDHNIKYENQKKFKDCKNIFPLPFDFYLPDYNMCIEFDGEQHFKQIHNWRFEQTLKNDIIKTNFCKNNNIDLLRIKYDENIIDRLKKKL